MNRYRKAAYIAVFGALWGGVEMFMGGFLHALNIPLRGMIMSGFAALIICTGQLWIGGRYTSLYLASIAAFLKLFSMGGLVLSPAVAIFMEGSIAVVVFRLLGSTITGCTVSSMLLVTYTIIHKFFSMALVYRMEFVEIYRSFADQGGIIAEIGRNSALIIIAVYAAIHLIFGAFAGVLAYLSYKKAEARMRQRKKLNTLNSKN